MSDHTTDLADELYDEYYAAQPRPHQAFTLDEVRLRPWYSDVAVGSVDLTTTIGPVTMQLPLLSAAMDTVSGPTMAVAMAEVGGCGITYRHRTAAVAGQWVRDALTTAPGMVKRPETLSPDQPLEEAWFILRERGFSTIPVIDRACRLEGVLFTRDIAFKGHMADPVGTWMTPLRSLKVERTGTPFARIRERLLNEQECSVLPIVDDQGCLKGIYFMKDLLHLAPATHDGRLLVGMAVGADPGDMVRVEEGIAAGVGMIVIDSSHGNCPPVIDQARRIVAFVKDRAAVVAGNIADIDGYLRLAATGVHAVKAGIGSGSICTTSSVTGVGVPMFSLLRELAFAKRKTARPPAIIADGGISGHGNMVVALAAGADACMAGQWLAGATESLSYQERGATQDAMVLYRGMASAGAIRVRSADRYGKGKTAPEGVEGYVPYRGPLKSWFGKELELIQGGCAHVGAATVKALHTYGDRPTAFVRFTAAGMNQIATRVAQ